MPATSDHATPPPGLGSCRTRGREQLDRLVDERARTPSRRLPTPQEKRWVGRQPRGRQGSGGSCGPDGLLASGALLFQLVVGGGPRFLGPPASCDLLSTSRTMASSKSSPPSRWMALADDDLVHVPPSSSASEASNVPPPQVVDEGRTRVLGRGAWRRVAMGIFPGLAGRTVSFQQRHGRGKPAATKASSVRKRWRARRHWRGTLIAASTASPVREGRRFERCWRSFFSWARKGARRSVSR